MAGDTSLGMLISRSSCNERDGQVQNHMQTSTDLCISRDACVSVSRSRNLIPLSLNPTLAPPVTSCPEHLLPWIRHAECLSTHHSAFLQDISSPCHWQKSHQSTSSKNLHRKIFQKSKRKRKQPQANYSRCPPRLRLFLQSPVTQTPPVRTGASLTRNTRNMSAITI